ncbi:hypothetical protein HYV31_01230 [candidate division WWE3 bacterium]|nr:hypothetical protein [candidate division WWE3 bacterium]
MNTPKSLFLIPWYWWLAPGIRLVNTVGKTQFIQHITSGKRVSISRKSHSDDIFLWARHFWTFWDGHMVEVLLKVEGKIAWYYLVCPLNELVREMDCAFSAQAHMVLRLWAIRDLPEGLKGSRLIQLHPDDSLVRRVRW